MCACASVEHQFQGASARVLFLISYQVHLVVVLSTASVVVSGDVETDKQRWLAHSGLAMDCTSTGTRVQREERE